MTVINRAQQGGQPELIAEGFERLEPITGEIAEQPHSWLERRLIIRSVELAQTGERGLRARLPNAQAAVTALNERRQGRRRCPDPSALREAVDTILTRYWVHGLLHIQYHPVKGTILGVPAATLWPPGSHQAAGVGCPADG